MMTHHIVTEGSSGKALRLALSEVKNWKLQRSYVSLLFNYMYVNSSSISFWVDMWLWRF